MITCYATCWDRDRAEGNLGVYLDLIPGPRVGDIGLVHYPAARSKAEVQLTQQADSVSLCGRPIVYLFYP